MNMLVPKNLRSLGQVLASATGSVAILLFSSGVAGAFESQRKLVISEPELTRQLNDTKRPEFDRVWADIRAPDGRFTGKRSNGFISLHGAVRDDRDHDGNAEEYHCQWDILLKTDYQVGGNFYFMPLLAKTVRGDCWIGSEQEKWGLADWGLGDWWIGKIVSHFQSFKPSWDHAAVRDTIAIVNYQSDRVELVLMHFGDAERKMLQNVTPNYKMIEGLIKK